jgi:DNA mismatch repair ATPase MutS
MVHLELGALLPAFALTLLFGALALTALWRKRASVRERERNARARWGHVVDRERNMEGIAALWRLRPVAEPDTYAIGDRTWRDLGLDAVFARIDRCSSVIGQQLLYRKLRAPHLTAEPLLAFDRSVAALEADPSVRGRLTTALGALSDAAVQSLAQVIYGTPVDAPRGAALFPLATFATIGAVAISFVHPWVLSIVLLLVVTNIAIRVFVFRELSAHVEGLKQVASLLGAAREIAELRTPGLARELEALRSSLAKLGARRVTLAWLTLDRLRLGEIAAMIVDYANVFLLLDVNAYVKELKFARTQRDTLAALFEKVGELDVALAVASYRAGCSVVTRPELRAGRRSFDVKGVCHPLVDEAVPNDVALEQRSYLITGSNMAGKSTYLKAVALQAILAQTIFVSTAQSYEAPFVRVETLVEVSDDLLSGRSHFLVEAETARAMLETSHAGTRCLCIVDELFRGTNSADRISAGAAFLRALHRSGAFVLAATHDRELLTLLDGEFAPHHFSESIDDRSALRCDYRLRAGAAAPRNALAVLELVGFPGDVLQEARATGAALEAHAARYETSAVIA